jgi:competence protein ComEA
VFKRIPSLKNILPISREQAQNVGMRRIAFLVSIALISAVLSTDSQAGTKKPDGLIDVNSATAAELQTLPGINATWSARIVRFRPYKSKLELLNGGVLPADIYERIKDKVIAHRPAKEPVNETATTHP